MRPKRIKELIANALEDPVNNPPVHLWGPPGVGKSRVVKSIAIEAGIGFVDNRPPLEDPTDYRGIPAVVDGVAKWLPPSDLPTPWFCMDCKRVLQKPDLVETKDGKISCKYCGKTHITDKGILMLDELTAAPPMTQAGCYQLILDGQIGEYFVPPGWYIVAAGNRIEDRAVAYRMSSALSNRFMHLEYDVNLDDWVDWALNEGHINPNIIGFLKFRGGDLLFAFRPESSERAFPTPRTWEFASKAIGFIRSKAILSEALDGTIGKGATAEFVSFLKVQTELPDLQPILDGKGAGSDYCPTRVDLKYALVSALATRANPKTHYENLVKYSEHLPEEFNVLLVTMLVSRDEGAIATCPSFTKWARSHADVILTKRMIK